MAMASPQFPQKKKYLGVKYIYIYVMALPPKTFKYLGPSPSNFLDPSQGEMSKYENLR
jgi:hypothetical protein